MREAKNTGLRNLPCRGWEENIAWLETLLTATDLVCWAKLLCFTRTPLRAHAEIATFRNLVLYVAPASPVAPGKSRSVSTTPGNTPTPSPKPG
jgi:hypothetical protein